MKYSEVNLRKYIKKCFEDSFKSENRTYSDKLWSFEWVIIINEENTYQLYPISWCKYDRVLRKVIYRLKNNLMKNFGIHYGDTEIKRCSVFEDNHIDFNFTQAMFIQNNRRVISLSIYDKNTNVYENCKYGECMVSYTYEKLLFKYWNLNCKQYKSLDKDDERLHLPSTLHDNWEEFKKLYYDTFNTNIGSYYDIIYSSGLKRI